MATTLDWGPCCVLTEQITKNKKNFMSFSHRSYRHDYCIDHIILTLVTFFLSKDSLTRVRLLPSQSQISLAKIGRSAGDELSNNDTGFIVLTLIKGKHFKTTVGLGLA